MASLKLGAVSLINESWVVFGSSLKLRIGFRNKRFRRVSERWRFRVQQMSVEEQMSKACFAKRNESLRRILKQYGISVESSEENNTSSRLDELDDSNMLNTGVLPTYLLPILGFCIVCIIGTLHTIISRKISQGHHHYDSKRTRWKTALSDWKEPLASSDELDSSQEYRIGGSTNQEAIDEVNQAYSRVVIEYKRFLLECGLSES